LRECKYISFGENSQSISNSFKSSFLRCVLPIVDSHNSDINRIKRLKDFEFYCRVWPIAPHIKSLLLMKYTFLKPSFI
jgi:hypothetical protein